MRKAIIAIDGPAGAGKSTVARVVAERLGYIYIDTGATYRALTLKVLRLGVPLSDRAALAALAGATLIEWSARSGEPPRIMMDHEDVTEAIRDPAVGRLVSHVAAVPEVREALVRLQRRLAAGGGVVVDGRDIGSHVLPDADFKFFVTASLEERTRRRVEQLVQQGHPVDPTSIRSEIQERDRLDETRQLAPLRVAPDAVVIDTTRLSVEEAAELILSYCHMTSPQGQRS